MTARDAAPTPEGVVLGAEEVSVAIKAQNPDLETAWRQIAWWEQTCGYWYERAHASDALLAAERAAHEGLVARLASALDAAEDEARRVEEPSAAIMVMALTTRLRAALAAGVRGE